MSAFSANKHSQSLNGALTHQRFTFLNQKRLFQLKNVIPTLGI